MCYISRKAAFEMLMKQDDTRLNISAQWRVTNTEIFDVMVVNGLHVSPSAIKQTIKKKMLEAN